MSAQFDKNFRGSCKLLQSHEKVCDENDGKKQKDVCVKMLLMEGRYL